MQMNHSKETQQLVSHVVSAIVETCGRMPRTEISLAHFFNHYEPAPLENLRATLQRSGYHCGQVKALRRLGEIGQRETYYQLVAERATLITEESLFDAISSCQALSVAYNVLYLSAIADTGALQPQQMRPLSIFSSLFAKLLH